MSKAHNVISGHVVSGRIVSGHEVSSRVVSSPLGVGRGGVPREAGRFNRRAALALGLVALVSTEPAFAANRVVWKKTKLNEQDKAWKIAFEVHLDRAPDVALVPFRLTFTATTYFERALVDGHKGPVVRQVPLQDPQPIIESVDVGFMDPASGKTAKRTRFSFEIDRERGFEAGHYDVKVTDARSGKDLGGSTTLTLEGDNEVIDRRSVVFDDSKPKPKKEEAAAPPPEEKTLNPDDEEFWAGGPKQPEEKTAQLPPPAHLQDWPGCGCRTAGSSSAGRENAASALMALGLSALLWCRTRRQQ